MNARRRQRGFTLLEAIVALTVFSTIALMMLAWLGSSIAAMEHAERSQIARDDMRVALAVMETVNPMAEPEGARQLPGIEIRWSAKPIVEQKPGMGPAGGSTIFDLAFYEVEVEVAPTGAPPIRQTLHRAGWMAVREPYTGE